MNRKGHIIGSVIFWTVIMILVYFLADIPLKENAMWIMLSFFVCQFGAQLPDYDLLWKKVLPHRNILTHSVFLPALVSMPTYFVIDETNMLLPLYAFFLIGYGSHLLLDLRPKAWLGSACIKLFWRNREGSKSMGGTQSYIWLILNGLILIVAGALIMFLFNMWMY